MKNEYTAVPVHEPIDPVDPATGRIDTAKLLRLLQQKVPHSSLRQITDTENNTWHAATLAEKLGFSLIKQAVAHHLELFTFTEDNLYQNTDPFLLSRWNFLNAARFSETLHQKQVSRFPCGIAQLRASTFKENTAVAHAKWLTLFLLTMGAAIACFGTRLFYDLSDFIDAKLMRLANETKYNETHNDTYPPINLAKIRINADLLVDLIYGIALVLTCCLSAFLLSRIDLSRRFPSSELKEVVEKLNTRGKQEQSNPVIDNIAQLLLSSEIARQTLRDVIKKSLDINHAPRTPAP